MQIYDIFKALRDDNSRKAKEAILSNNKDNELLLRVLKASYDQNINYYISTISPTSTGSKEIDDECFEILDELSNRKITGNAASERLNNYANTLTKESQAILKCIIEKDIRAGVTATTLAKIWKDVPEFKDFSCMLCDEFEKNEKKVKYPVYGQLKFDASRILILVDDNNILYKTRNGKTYNITNEVLDGEIYQIFKSLKSNKIFENGIVLDGEIYQLDKDGNIQPRQFSNGISTKFVRNTASKEENENIGITLWDLVPLDEWKSEKFTQPYELRYDTLKEFFNFEEKYTFKGDFKHLRIPINHITYTPKEVYEFSERVITAGEEGIIIKLPNSLYEKKRSKSNLKVKDTKEADLLIIGIEPGTGKYEGKVGSLICRDKSGTLQVAVGSGLTDKDRETLNESVIGNIVSVKYNMVIPNSDKSGNTLFLPRFVEVRFDKKEPDLIK